jgi:hypothetical protein
MAICWQLQLMRLKAGIELQQRLAKGMQPEKHHHLNYLHHVHTKVASNFYLEAWLWFFYP